LALNNVTVRGVTSLEEVGVVFTLLPEDYVIDASPVPEEEAENYDDIERQLELAVATKEETSRSLVSYGRPFWRDGASVQNCISVVQLLLGRGENNAVCVFMRSCEQALLHHDKQFFCRLATRWGCQKIVLMIGSLH